MDKSPKKVFRCAIYTRKSTDHNLDLEFNSLDAQREACEAYIKSQAHEGWRLIRERYDDGAFSGASLERPALQALLEEVSAGQIDIIIVYKVDRLTRSLADFAKLVELFDANSVSFVSVTQSFNTTNSMGRLTLNVLLSFAQFEREVIGERVRDKIAASKAKGIWVGGSVPLGYKSIDKKLVILPDEADTVRSIFQRYLELGSIRALVEALDREGVRTRRLKLSTGETRGGIRFGVGGLAHLLRNRFYIGEVVYRGKVHQGGHEPILNRPLFDAVQTKLAESANARELRLKGSPAILTGRFFDDRGNRMTPTHTNKRGARYRYYVSHAILQKRDKEAGTVTRVSAAEVESLITNAVRAHIAPAQGEGNSPSDDRTFIERHVHRVVVKSDAIEIHIARLAGSAEEPTPDSKQENPLEVIAIPWSANPGPDIKGIIHKPSEGPRSTPPNSEALLTAIARARGWIEDIVEGRAASFAEIAEREGKVERHIRLLAPLAFLSPRIVSHVARCPLAGTRITDLAKAPSWAWKRQEEWFGASLDGDAAAQ